MKPSAYLRMLRLVDRFRLYGESVLDLFIITVARTFVQHNDDNRV